MLKTVTLTGLAGGLLMTTLVWSSAQATISVPNPQGALGTGGDVIHVGPRGGGRGGSFSRGGGGGGHALRGGGGGGRYARGVGGGGGGRYAYRGGGKYHGYKGSKHYAYKGHGNYNRYKHYGRYNNYRRFYGWPYIAYGYGYGGCNWLYRNAVATGSSYWWNRYYQCTGYY